MAAELVRGQNHPLPDTRLEIRVSAGAPVVAAATLGDEQGRSGGPGGVVHPGAPRLPGLEVSRQAAAEHRLAVDLGALPATTHRVSVLLALPTGIGGPARFGAVPSPHLAVTGLDGTEIAGFTLTDLTSESAVVALELYRRQGAWKVRAVGQGYEGGLPALFADQRVPDAAALAVAVESAVAKGHAAALTPPPRPAPHDGTRSRTAAAAGAAGHAPGPPTAGAGLPPQPRPQPPSPGVPPQQGAPVPGPGERIDYSHPRRERTAPPAPSPAPPTEAPVPFAGDASGWSMDERLYNQVWGMFEDLARAVAAYRSAEDFAQSRLEKELDAVLSDPRDRVGTGVHAARAAAHARHDELVAQARAVLDRDLDQLQAEAAVVEPALPPAFADWGSPVWQTHRPSAQSAPLALRLGDLHLPERPSLCIPMLVRLPLERGLWIDSGRASSEAALLHDDTSLRRLALESAVAHTARLVAVHPPGAFTAHVIDAAGAGSAALAPLTASGVLAGPPATGPAGVTATLSRLAQRVDLVQMAIRGGAPDALPSDLDPAEQLLIVHDFPHGFDDRAVTQLRYLAEEGPKVGVHLMMVADREDAASYGPLLDPLWRSLLRLTPLPDDHLADPWVGHAWTFAPAVVPPGSGALASALEQAAAARRGRRP
ncbi:TerD family protein [Streptomyces sp. NPDC060194]|uniref:TerD family protein n=1 Tax=Streptomyces sp. NPDC060194 TaxID=3347069 RepID=UPI0036482CBC